MKRKPPTPTLSRSQYQIFPAGVKRPSIWEKRWHPWQQPLALFEDLVLYFSDPGDLTVDPCGGGFTTAEACLRLGRQ